MPKVHADILDTIDSSASVLYYPSSCQYAEEFQDLPFDAVILNSHEMRKPGRRDKVYCLDFDNNALLGMLCARNIRVSALVIIRDGCEEGGNYECITRAGFFGRLVPVVTEPFVYSYDHKKCSTHNVPAHFEAIDDPAYVSTLRRKSDPFDGSHSFRVTTSAAVERDIVLGQVRVQVIRDSIWRGIEHSDFVVARHFQAGPIAVEQYLEGRFPNSDWHERIEYVDRAGNRRIRHYLELANERRLSRLLLMPIARGQYQAIVDEIQRWDKEYPQEVIFYHLHSDDYRSIRNLR